MNYCMRAAVVLIISAVGFFALGPAAQAADDPCAPKRLDWMLEDEQCGDLVFADVIEIMHACDDARLRARAASGLGRYRGREVFSALYLVLEKDRSPMVREAALKAFAGIIERTRLKPGREIMEACFLVYQFDRYAPNRAKAHEMLKRFNASAQMLAERTYVSARYRALEALQVRSSAKRSSTITANLQPGDAFAINDESYGNDRTTCWFSIETSSGVRGWVCGLQDSKQYIGTDDSPLPPVTSSVGSFAEIRNPAQSITIGLRTSSKDDTFRPGDEIAFFVKTDRDCFVTLIYSSPTAGGYILFPNRDQADMLVRAGNEVRIPSEGSTLVFKASDPAVEEITVIATRFPLEVFPPQEVEQGPIRAIKTGRRETARGIDRLLRYFKPDVWAIAHKAITVVE